MPTTRIEGDVHEFHSASDVGQSQNAEFGRSENASASGLQSALGLMRSSSVINFLAWGLLVGAIAWAYAPALWGLATRWWKEADYGHGFFVPVFSAILLAIRWKDFRGKSFHLTTTALLAGIGFLAAAWFCRFVSHQYYFRLLDPASIIPALMGVALLIGGWNGLAWSWPAIVFLVFMIPLPGAVADMLRHPLQRIGTIASTYILQVVGVPAIARGNIIVLTKGELGVVEACSGLRMMVLFFAVCVGAAFLVKRPIFDRILMVISAPVIAVAANVVRISITGILHELTTPQLADFVFHDLAGWLMAPVALGILAIEMWWLDKVLVPVTVEPPLNVLGAPNARGSLPQNGNSRQGIPSDQWRTQASDSKSFRKRKLGRR